jgi:hypothetical protein
MDDLTSSPPARLTLSRECEASRLQGQLLARAYQHLFPQVRRPIVDRAITSPVTHSHEDTSTAARVAAGA